MSLHVPKLSPSARNERAAVRSLYHLLSNRAVADDVADAYAGWLTTFEVVHGTLNRKRVTHSSRLTEAYGLPAAEFDLHRLLFAIETYLAIRVASVLATVRARPSDAGDRAVHEAPQPIAGLTGHGGEYFDWVSKHIDRPEASDFATELTRISADEAPTPPGTDIVGGLYQELVPKQVRHALGAFYTPPWLADYVLSHIGYEAGRESTPTRVLDPTCGFGVFLLAAARSALRAEAQGLITPDDAARIVAESLVGIDIDPMAVLGARANLALVVAALVQRGASEKWLESGATVLYADSVAESDPARDHDSLDGLGTFDLVVGNPPWVNWEYLPPDYREVVGPMWPRLGLFNSKGLDLAFSKEDFSVLVTFAVCQRFLRDRGQLGFVMPQSVFKSSLNSRGFRRFELGDNGAALRVDSVEDLVAVRPFEGVANRTSVLFLTKGPTTEYPVPYHRWDFRSDCKKLSANWSLAEVMEGVVRIDEAAMPAYADDATSHWATGPGDALTALQSWSGPPRTDPAPASLPAGRTGSTTCPSSISRRTAASGFGTSLRERSEQSSPSKSNSSRTTSTPSREGVTSACGASKDVT